MLGEEEPWCLPFRKEAILRKSLKQDGDEDEGDRSMSAVRMRMFKVKWGFIEGSHCL